MRILLRHLIVVFLAGTAHAQPAPPPPNPFSPPAAGTWADGSWKSFRALLCNQVLVRTDDLAAAYVEIDATMGKNPAWCARSARSLTLAGGALQALGVVAQQFEASSTSLNKIDNQRFDFHGIKWDDDAVKHAAAIDCNASTAEAHALFDARFADIRKTLGDMPEVCGTDIDSLIARRRKSLHNVDAAPAPAPAPAPQTVNVNAGCSQTGTLPSLLGLGAVLRRRRRTSR